MKSVCICGSFKFYDEMGDLRTVLQARGIICEWPTLGPRRNPQAMTPDEAKEAITRHLERMDRADLIFVFNRDGYLGNSVVMEIGYAYARRKPIYVLAPIQERLFRFKLTGPPMPRDTAARNADAVSPDSPGSVSTGSLIGINSKIYF
jgi:nucleoside 2-deoxyribosyltransferase